MDSHQDLNNEFYDRLQKGDVERKDFERYIYGGSKNLQQKEDGRDKIEAHDRREMLKTVRGAHPSLPSTGYGAPRN